MLRGITGLAVIMCGSMLLTSFDVSATRYYKSVDENGNVVFSDRPASSAAEQINVQVFTPNVAAPPAPSAKRVEKTGEGKTENARQDLKALQAVRAENCKKAKSYLNKLQTVSRLYSEDDKGVRTYVSDEERVTQFAEAHASVSDWCQ